MIERALAAGVTRMVAIGTGNGPPDLECAVRLADRHDFMYATVGVHPHDASKAAPETFARLKQLAGHPKVVAIGEIGLDYHYDFSPRDTQRAVFEEQLAIAAEAGLPVVIHTREAWHGHARHCCGGTGTEAASCTASRATRRRPGRLSISAFT